MHADAGFLETLDRLALFTYASAAFGWDEAEMARRFRAELDSTAREVVVVDGHDVGSIVVEDHGDHWVLDYIAILPEYQRRGIGTVLVRELLERAAEAGRVVRLNVLRVNPARELYERLGFHVFGSDEHRWHMEWTPAPAPPPPPLTDRT